MGYYPSTPKIKQSKPNKSVSNALKNLALENNQEPKFNFLTQINDKEMIKCLDEWSNQVASLNANNSLMQYSVFNQERLSYAECASLYTDDWINRTISIKTNDLIDNRGIFSVIDEVENSDDIIRDLENELNRLDFWRKFKDLIQKAYIFGGAFLFIDCDTNDDGYEKPIYKTFETLSQNPIRDFKIIEAWLMAPQVANLNNPLAKDYMKPNKWYIAGGGIVDSSRLRTLSFYEIPDLYKPMYNFLGVSLCQIMKDFVKQAKSMIASSSDLFLRFRTMIIKSDLLTTNPDEAVARAKANNQTMNNLGVMLLTNREEFIESITPIAGVYELLDKVCGLVGGSAGIPLFKLFGDNMGGGLNSGVNELKQYYDDIESIQNTILKPLVVEIAQMIAYSLGYNVKIDFTFNKISNESKLEQANRENLEVDKILKLVDSQIIDTEQAFKIAQANKLIPSDESFNLGGDDDFENDDETEQEKQEKLEKILANE